MAKFEWDHPLRGDKCKCGGLKLATFNEKRAITWKVQDRRVVSIIKSNRKSYLL